MKIMSNKKYEELVQKLTDVALDLEQAKSDNCLYKEQVSYLSNCLDDTKVVNFDLEGKLIETKKEIKRLKSLLTKNKINYKKENKNGKSN